MSRESQPPSRRTGHFFNLDLPITRIMTVDPVCVRPDISGALARLLMLDRGIGALPVVDEHGRPLGILSKTDMVRESAAARLRDADPGDATLQRLGLIEDEAEAGLGPRASGVDFYVEEFGEPKVRDLMTPFVVSVNRKTSIREAASLMTDRDVHHLPVIGDRGELLGIVSTFDFVRAMAELNGRRSQAAENRAL
jgi:CBS domain-containing protein